MRRGPLVLVFALAVAGCGSKDAVSLSASVQNADLQVTQVALGTKLSGGFELWLELGARADGATDVTPDKFSITGTDDSTIVPTLSASTTESYPIHVGVGQKHTLAFTLDDKNPLDASAQAALCAGPVVIAGSVTDTLGGGKSTPVSSAAFNVTGCP